VTSTVVTIGSTLLGPFTPLPPGTGVILATSITASLNLIEQVAMLPLDIGQALTSTSITLASSSVDVLTSMFGTHEASFSLAEFVTLVRREWNDPVLKERLPIDKDKYGLISVGKALIAWAALQCATRGWHESRWRNNMREIGDEEWTEVSPTPPLPRDMSDEERRSFMSSFSQRMRNASIISRGSRVFVREDLMLPEQGGQIISADIGEKWDTPLFAQSNGM
jgi:sn1-specific diacylglycerol lipase